MFLADLFFFWWKHPLQRMSLAEFVFGFRGYSPSTEKNLQKAPSVIKEIFLFFSNFYLSGKNYKIAHFNLSLKVIHCHIKLKCSCCAIKHFGLSRNNLESAASLLTALIKVFVHASDVEKLPKI